MMVLINRQRYLLEELAKLIEFRRPLVFVDAGCGTGNMLKSIRAHAGHWHIYAFDESLERCNECKVACPYADIVPASVCKIPYADTFADVVVCSEVLEHLPYESHMVAANELLRITRPNGIIVITTPGTLDKAGRMVKMNHVSFLDESLLIKLFGDQVLKKDFICKKDLDSPTLVMFFKRSKQWKMCDPKQSSVT